MALFCLVVVYGNGHGLLRSHQHHEPPAPGDGGIDQVALEEDIVLGQQGNHHHRILGSLGLVDG